MIKKTVHLPDPHCVICRKSLDEIGGKRIVAQQPRGWILSDTYKEGGNKDCPKRSVELKDSNLPSYLVIWGDIWDEKSIQRAKTALYNNKSPWFCQICGVRACHICNEPINYPMGSDLLTNEGDSTHAGIFPFSPGCVNKICSNYKEWNIE